LAKTGIKVDFVDEGFRPWAVYITVKCPKDNAPKIGSGVLIGADKIITSAHIFYCNKKKHTTKKFRKNPKSQSY
jgi:hypothetical protein